MNGGGGVQLQDPSKPDYAWDKVVLPHNLAIVGTVNMDESTHRLSKKVLDRAFTIELSEVDLSAGLASLGYQLQAALAVPCAPAEVAAASEADLPNGHLLTAQPQPWPVSAW